MACCIWRLFQKHGLRKSVKCKSKKNHKKHKKTLPKSIPKIIWGLLKWRQGSVEVHSVNLQHEFPVYLTTKKREQNSIIWCQQKHKQQQKGRKPEEKLISSYGNDFFQGKHGSGELQHGQCQEEFRAFAVQLEVWDPALARAFPSITVRQDLAGSFQQNTQVKTHSRALSGLRLTLICNVYKYFPKSAAGA